MKQEREKKNKNYRTIVPVNNLKKKEHLKKENLKEYLRISKESLRDMKRYGTHQ